MAHKDENGVYWLSINDAAKWLSLKPQQVYNMCTNGTIKSEKIARIGGFRFRIPSTEIDRLRNAG
jgi:hypothetical protein